MRNLSFSLLVLVFPLISKAQNNSSENSINLKGINYAMIEVKGGTFVMGCPPVGGTDCDNDEKPGHQVILSDYYLGETEVTQALWKAVMGDNPSHFNDNDQLPVESVSWEQAQIFIQKLNQITGQTFRLPTEAEWEFAAKGGNNSNNTVYAGNTKISKIGWYQENSENKTHPVKQKKANELGLYDMTGNVWEWCQDSYGDYTSASQKDPQGGTDGFFRVYRGGSWFNIVSGCKVTTRGFEPPANSRSNIGLRLARSK